MALKITTQIGTDKGITSEAYVRIADYQISKYGSANFRIELFEAEPVAPTGPAMYPGMSTARNQQIGESLYVSMTKEEEKTHTVKRMVSVEVPATVEGEPATVTMEEQDIEETYTVTVPDLSTAEGVDIFAFGYSHLKTKLEGLFGAENVVDC